MRAKKQHALREQTVAACTTGFLVIGLESSGHVVVDHIPQIRFVDPHAKGVRGDDCFELACHEFFLDQLALFGQQSCMVGTHREFQLLAELLDQGLAAFSGGDVDDARFVALGKKIVKMLVLVPIAHAKRRAEVQVVACKAGDECASVFELKAL